MAGRRHRMRGFTMVEVLVTIIIMCFGLLGLAMLHVRIQQSELEAYQRAQALTLLSDKKLVSRINANRQTAPCYAISDMLFGTPYLGAAGSDHLGAPVCTGHGSASTRARAISDLTASNEFLNGTSETQSGLAVGAMIGARGCVSFNAVAKTYTVASAGHRRHAGAESDPCKLSLRPRIKRRVVWTTLIIGTLSEARTMMIRAYKAGFSLVEPMVAMAIGLALLAGLVSVFAISSRAHRELQQTAQLLDNGRFAIETISSDLQQAGFYGQFYDLPAAKASLPDPCDIVSAANLYTALPYPRSSTARPITPARGPFRDEMRRIRLTDENLLPGTDVLVIRRADGNALAATDVPADRESISSLPSWRRRSSSAAHSAASIGTTKKADGMPTASSSSRRTGHGGGNPQVPRSHLFIAPCSLPADPGDVCTGAADDSGRPIPTLKRLELTASDGTTTLRIVPLAEGIENLQVEFGIDDTPTTPQPLTGRIGDGAADFYVDAPSPSRCPM